ncbi:MAG: tetratricopeptide repeat protein [Acidobacteriota bacterium]
MRLTSLLIATVLLASLAVPSATADIDFEAVAARAFEAGRAAVDAGNDTVALDHFERALRAKADDLRTGSEYRQAIIRLRAYDRAIAFFEELVQKHPKAPNAHLNLGYAYVDKSPDEGAVTQVLLANTALEHFSAALEAEETWLVRYTRGNSYLYWPPIFGRTQLGLVDLERAIEIAETAEPRSYHVRAWVALGDGHVRLGDLEAAHDAWNRGMKKYPNDGELARRLSTEDAQLETLVNDAYATDRRVDTDLSPIWKAD